MAYLVVQTIRNKDLLDKPSHVRCLPLFAQQRFHIQFCPSMVAMNQRK